MNLYSSVLKFVLMFVLLLASGLQLIAQEPADRVTVKLKVTAPDSTPVEGATLRPLGMVMKSNSGRSYMWIDRESEKNAELTSNENGIILLSFPKHPKANEEVARISVEVSHPSFSEYKSWLSVEEDPIQILLEHGFRVAATAVDSDGNKIKQNLFANTNHSDFKNWDLKASGMLVSPVLRKDEVAFRITEVIDGKATRFSDLIEIETDDKARIMKQNIVMHDAVEIRGKLSANVPRPVKSGFVSACVVSLREKDRTSSDNAWHCASICQVDEDGTFVLSEIPRDTVVQIFVVSEGWSSVSERKEEVLRVFPGYHNQTNWVLALPQFVNVAKESRVYEIAMQPTASCVVKVVDENANPIVGAKVGCSTGSQIFHSQTAGGYGYGPSTSALLEELRQVANAASGGTAKTIPAREKHGWCKVGRVANEATDSQGRVSVKNLGPGLAMGYASHPDFRGAQSNFRIEVKSGEESDVSIVLRKLQKPEVKNAEKPDTSK